MTHITATNNSARFKLAIELFGNPHQVQNHNQVQICVWFVENEDIKTFDELSKEIS